MPGDYELLEAKVERLAGQLNELSRRLDYLYSYLRIPTGEETGSRESESPKASPREGIIGWADRASLLPGVSVVCFLLAVALILRTLTDNDVLEMRIGSLLGMGYAAALMLTGYWKYERRGRLGSVFFVCGALLICSVVVESYQRFHSLPVPAAYAVLLAVGVGSSVTGYRFGKDVPAAVGLLGMCAAAAALEYPNPFFPALAGILLIANVLGLRLRDLRGSSWIRWAVFFITLFVMSYWSGKLTVALGRKEQELPAFLAFSWFLPFVGSFSVLYPALCLLGIVHKKAKDIRRFEVIVPTLTGLWGFGAAYQVVDSWGRDVGVLGLAGLFLGAGYLGAAHWLGRMAWKVGRGTNSFGLGACLLIVLSLPLVTGSVFLALPFLSGMALGLFGLSGVWKSGGVRVISYLLQAYSATATALLLWEGAQTIHLAAGVLLGGFVSFAGSLHYAWALKSTAPHDSSVFFSRYDTKDRTAAVALAGSILSGFFVLRASLKEALYMLPGDFQNSFWCAQSILVNLFAAGLMFYAYFRVDQAARNLAIALTLIGAVKVFTFDLLQARGIPLVLSVLSFGVVVLLESILLGRWQRSVELPGGDCFSRPQGSRN